jgi:nucleoside-diphosphate-sugar epimerase
MTPSTDSVVPAKNSPVFITGASGFIGGEIARRLLKAGRPVRVLARRPLPALEKLGAEVVLGDLLDAAALRHGCAGVNAVYHAAARVGLWGPEADFQQVNVEGTRAVIAACRDAGVARLINTSSPSVVYNGTDLRDVDESAPLCTQAPSPYPTTKAAAEKLVSEANDSRLTTVSLRPHLVWGPGDKNLIPRVVAVARRRRLKIVGAGANKVDLTHISNVADAHLLAEQALPSTIGGKAYFISNGEPVLLWEWINELLRGLGVPEIQNHVSQGAASAVGCALEVFWRIFPLRGDPPMTRFMAKEMATDHWFNISAARRDLGYDPKTSMAAGMKELIDYLRATS